MERHQRSVLEQRVRAGPWLGIAPWTRAKGLEAVSMRAKKNVATRYPTILAHTTNGSCAAVAVAVPHGRQVTREDERPQQDRAGQVRPHRCHAVQERRKGAVVVVYVNEGEIVCDQCPLHRHGGHDGARHYEPYVRLAGPQ